MKNMGIQGDVRFVKIASVPKDAIPIEGKTVARGERTGHHHSFRPTDDVKLSRQPNGTVIIEVGQTAVLSHQEHNPITVEPGIYEDRGVVEHRWGQTQRVMD